jgi:hypothetical protein
MVIAPPTVKYGIKIISLTILPEMQRKSKPFFKFPAAFCIPGAVGLVQGTKK